MNIAGGIYIEEPGAILQGLNLKYDIRNGIQAYKEMVSSPLIRLVQIS